MFDRSIFVCGLLSKTFIIFDEWKQKFKFDCSLLDFIDSMIFILITFLFEFIYLPLHSLPSKATRSEHYSQSNVVIAKDSISPFRAQSPSYIPD